MVHILRIKNFQTYNKFLTEYPEEKISKFTFYNYIPKNFKIVKRRTDVCPICKTEDQIKNKLKKLPLENFEYEKKNY